MYPGCKVILGNVSLNGSSIRNVDSLLQLEQIAGELYITNLDSLENLHGLANLESIGQAIRIQNNPVLESLDGLENLQKSAGDFFYISNNPLLTDVDGLSGLDSVAGIFQIWEQDLIQHLNGLQQLRWAGNTVAIFENAALQSLDGLQQLETVGSDLRIYENPVLTDLTALHHPVSILGALVISDNPQLGSCAVQAVCDYLAAPSTFTSIMNNAPGCESQETVAEACASSSTHTPDSGSVRVFPNPGTDVLTIETAAGEPVEALVRNAQGQLLATPQQNSTQLDISTLLPGYYWLEIRTEKQRRVQGFVKM